MFRFGTATQPSKGSAGRRLGGLAAACVIVGLGCTDVSEPLDVPPVSRAVAALDGEELSTLQREWSAYAKQAPGFAGMFVDDTGRLVVRTVNMSEGEVLRQAVQPMAQQFQAQVSGTRVEPADYSFAQLVRWHSAIRTDLFGTPGWTTIYIDYIENQIGIGFAPEHEADVGGAGLAAARGNGVPEDAIFFYAANFIPAIGRGAPPAALRDHTVRHSHDPLIGGTRVLSEAFDRPPGQQDGWCTMTLNVRWSFENPNQPMWLTNAHCSREIGVTELDEWWQPTWSYGVVGYNAVDRLFPGSVDGAHGYADVTMQYKKTFGGSMGNRGTAIGQIVATAGSVPFETPGQSGSLQVSSITPPLRVVGVKPPIQGLTVRKTGAKTGTTAGRISRIDVTSLRNFNNQFGVWALLEQVTARYWSDFGDSGSPVYMAVPGPGILVDLVGQTNGITTLDPQTRESIFSPWDGVREMVEWAGSPICFTVSCQ